MHKKKFENIVGLSTEDRYDYFVSTVAEMEEIWGLYQENGWATMGHSVQNLVIPFWPEQEFAAACATERWSGYTPKAIPLDDFINKWLPGMKKDNTDAGIFYTVKSKMGAVIKPDVLLDDIDEELKRFY